MKYCLMSLTMVQYAVQSGSVETVQLMLDMGANVNELNHSWNGYNPSSPSSMLLLI